MFKKNSIVIFKEELLSLNERGIIPGPYESIVDFKKRVESIEKNRTSIKEGKILSWSDFDWARSTASQLFDIAPDWVVAYYSNKGLKFWQGAVTYAEYDGHSPAVIQIRKNLKNGKYLFLYDKDEILSHEIIHAARMAFNEPKTEELFAYWTSTSHFRKLFGPIFRSQLESTIFMGILCSGISLQFFLPFFSSPLLFSLIQLSNILSLSMLTFCLFRLYRTRLKLNQTLKKLTLILDSKQKARSVLFRLTDKEIYFFAKSSITEIMKYIQNQEELRWQVIGSAYF